MTLKVRLLLGYGYLVALLLLAAVGAMLGFLELSAGIDLVLEENLKSIEATMGMIDALERQDSATLAALIEGDTEVVELEAFEADFAAALAVALGNVTEEEEPPVLAAIEGRFADYRRERDALLAAQPERPLAAYNRRVFPLFSQVKGGLFRLLEINQGAIVEADREAKETAVQNGAWLGFLATIALVSLVLLSRAMQRQILSRLEELKEGTATITHGDLSLRLRERGSDELTAIAHHFNQVLDQRQQVERRLAGRLAQERRLVLGLVEHLGPGAVLYELSGERLAGDDPRDRWSAVEDWLREEGRRRLTDTPDFTEPVRESVELGDGATAELRLLTTGPGRPVAWLARRVPTAES